MKSVLSRLALVGLGLGLGVAHAGRPVAAPAGLVTMGTHTPKVAGLVVINGTHTPKVSGLVVINGTHMPKIQGR